MTMARDQLRGAASSRVDPQEARGRLRQALAGAFRLVTGGADEAGRTARRTKPRAGKLSEGERRYSAYWHGTENSLFTVRVPPDGSFRFDGINPAHEARPGLSQAPISGRRPQDVLPAETA